LFLEGTICIGAAGSFLSLRVLLFRLFTQCFQGGNGEARLVGRALFLEGTICIGAAGSFLSLRVLLFRLFTQCFQGGK
jgi:hypothetical protein